ISPAEKLAARVEYAAALVHLAEVHFAQKPRRAQQIAGLAAAAGTHSQLRRRISVLLGEPVREPLRLTGSGVMTLVLFAMALFLMPAVVVSNDQQAEVQSSVGAAIAAGAEVKAADATGSTKQPSPVKVLAIGYGESEGQTGPRWWSA